MYFSPPPPAGVRQIGVGPQDERTGGEQVLVVVRAARRKRQHGRAAGSHDRERPRRDVLRPGGDVGQAVADPDVGLRRIQLDEPFFLDSRGGFRGRRQMHAVGDRFNRDRLVVGGIG